MKRIVEFHFPIFTLGRAARPMVACFRKGSRSEHALLLLNQMVRKLGLIGCLRITFMSVTWWLVFYNLCQMPKSFCIGTVVLVVVSALSKALVPPERKKTKDIIISVLWALVWFPWLSYELLSRNDVTLHQFAYTAGLVFSATLFLAAVCYFIRRFARNVKNHDFARKSSTLFILLCLTILAKAAVKILRC